jgi:hypothetical protein
MLALALIFYPFTGGVELFTRLYTEVRDRAKNTLLLYNIFDGRVVRRVICSCDYTDPITGTEVRQDLRKLYSIEPRVYWEIAFNADWIFFWIGRRHDIEWLGCWRDVLEDLHKLEQLIVLGDIYLWTEARYIAEKYGNTLLVFTRRSLDEVVSEYITRVKAVEQGKLRLFKLFKRGDPRVAARILEVILYYEKLSGEKLRLDRVSPRDVEWLVEYTYRDYLGKVSELASMSNVVIVDHGRDSVYAVVAKLVARLVQASS